MASPNSPSLAAWAVACSDLDHGKGLPQFPQNGGTVWAENGSGRITLDSEGNLPAGRHCGALVATGRRDPTVLGQLRHNEDMESVVVRNSAIMSGAPTFRGTRVLVRTLFEYLEAGHSLERFLEGFPTVSREQAQQALEEARESLLASH